MFINTEPHILMFVEWCILINESAEGLESPRSGAWRSASFVRVQLKRFAMRARNTDAFEDPLTQAAVFQQNKKNKKVF
jgi:hypothetical protein